ncbi:MAG: hypothetical protein NTY66_00655 [Candidatus Vogelbacteria bacterium]|nr:hypothetical protein [Candidatus Vogelbacteria bacterium]
MTNIVIIGAGEIGIALGRVLKTGDRSVKLWDKDPGVVAALGGESLGLPGIVPTADFVFICVPSWALREALFFISPYLGKKAVVVSVTKGIEAGSLKLPDEMLASLLPKRQSFALMSGPMIAEELRDEKGGGAVVVSSQEKIVSLVSKLFDGSQIQVVPGTDVHGTALCGVIKNVYALALGISFGLGLGENARGNLLVQMLGEMKKILATLGGKQETALGLAGLGDLIATGFSSNSKNHEAGVLLAKGAADMQSEGLASVNSLWTLLGAKSKKFPLLQIIHSIVSGDKEAGVEFEKLLT